MCGSKSDGLALIPRRLAKDAEELVALPVDVILVVGGTRAANTVASDTLGADCVQQYRRSGR